LLTVTVAVPFTLPDVAVTVIAVPAAAVPADREADAVPVVPVVTEVGEMVPADVENVIVAPLTGALLASVAEAVMVEAAEPSDGMVALLAVTAMFVTVVAGGVGVTGVGVTNALSPLPPHAAKPNASAARTVIDTNFLMSHPTLKTAWLIRTRVSRR
jgi:hypothetical protein